MTGQETASIAERGTRKRLSAKDRRFAIVAAARKIFARSGYHGAGTAEIASASNCSEPMIYKHFSSKQALFAAVLDDALASMGERFDRLISESGGDPLESLVSFSQRMADDPEFTEIIQLRTLSVTLVHEPDIHRALKRSTRRIQRRISKVIAASQELGNVRSDIDPDQAAWIWLGLKLTAAHRHALEGSQGLSEMPDISRALLNMLRPAHSKKDSP